MGKEVDILGKGTKCKLLSIINEVLLHLDPTLLFEFMPQQILSMMPSHAKVPRHLLISHHTMDMLLVLTEPSPLQLLHSRYLPPINFLIILPEAQP